MGQKRETGGLVTLKVSLAAVGIDRSGRSEGEGGLGAHQPTLGSGQTVRHHCVTKRQKSNCFHGGGLLKLAIIFHLLNSLQKKLLTSDGGGSLEM